MRTNLFEKDVQPIKEQLAQVGRGERGAHVCTCGDDPRCNVFGCSYTGSTKLSSISVLGRLAKVVTLFRFSAVTV